MRLPDVTLAVRNLVRRPGFAVAAILLLALGAGANAAVFSVVRAVLLKPLAYRQPEQLVAFWPNVFVSTEETLYWRVRADDLGIALVVCQVRPLIWIVSMVIQLLRTVGITNVPPMLRAHRVIVLVVSRDGGPWPRRPRVA